MGSLYDEALDRSAMGLGLVDEAEIEEIVEPKEEKTEEEKPEQNIRLLNLLEVGYITTTVDIGTNQIVLRTLKIGEELEAALLADPWKDTAEAGRAVATATVAASVVSVNGGPVVKGLGPQDQDLQAKFDYIRRNWYWNTIGVLYTAYDQQLLGQLIGRYEDLLKA